MSYSFRRAVPENDPVRVALSGPSGSGKTKSALRLATGLAGKTGKVALIDTEYGRARRFATEFAFDHGILSPPYTPEAYIEAVDAHEKAGHDVIIIDSASHEFAGEGGLQEWADRLEEQGVKSPGNWREPKEAHRKMINRFLKCRAHLILTFRAEEKIKVDRVNGKVVVVPVGWKPIAEKNTMYEMTASFLLLDTASGVPVPIKKIEDRLKGIFAEDAQINEETGKALAAWASSGAPKLESKARTLALTAGDGTVRVFPTAMEWLTALDSELHQAASTIPVLQKLWDNNNEMLFKIESAARGRKDETMLNAVNAAGAFALGKLGMTSSEAEQ